MSIKGQGHFLTIYFPGFVFFCFTRPRYQVSVYRTIGPLVSFVSCLNHTKLVLEMSYVPSTFTVFPSKNEYIYFQREREREKEECENHYRNMPMQYTATVKAVKITTF